MQLSQTENDLIHNNNFNIVGTSVSGVDNYVGPVIACSIVLDYFSISPLVKKFLSKSKLDKSELKELISSFRYMEFCTIDESSINSLRSIELAEHMAKFNCANKLVWSMLQKCEVPDVYITSDKDLTEVIDTINDSVHTEHSERYVLWNTNHSLELVTPKATFITKKVNQSLVTKLCKKFADLMVRHRLQEIDLESNHRYNFADNTGIEQVELVKKYGNTIYHRVFLPELSKYPVGKLLWGDK